MNGNYRNERSEYANNENKTHSAEGRRLRPRKRITRTSERTSERVSFDSESGHSERRSFERKPNSLGYKRSGRRSFGERSSYGGGDRRETYSERRKTSSYYTQRRDFDNDRRSFGDGERRPYSGGGERRSFGDRKPYSGGGERRSFGERPSYGGDRRPSFKRGFGAKNYSNRGTDGRRGFEGRRGYNGDFKERRSFGNRPYRRDNFRYNDAAAEAGINQMINKRAEIDKAQLSDNDTVKTFIKDEVRLNKFIANSGMCSRREADDLILAGVVTVNGEVVTTLGTKVNIKTDDVRFNGERLKGEEKIYIVMNKPRGFVTTMSDPHADRTVFDLLKGCRTRVFPVGRLDKNTTGVLMFTNDGEIAERLTHPSYDKKKIYQVTLNNPLEQEDHSKILEGIELHDGVIAADELEYIDDRDHRKLGIKIHSGKNRIVRRLFEELGYDVRALDRVYFAGLTKKCLKKGEWRVLSEGEVNILKMGAYI